MFNWIRLFLRHKPPLVADVDPLILEAFTYSKRKLEKDPGFSRMDTVTRNKELTEWAIHYINEKQR